MCKRRLAPAPPHGKGKKSQREHGARSCTRSRTRSCIRCWTRSATRTCTRNCTRGGSRNCTRSCYLPRERGRIGVGAADTGAHTDAVLRPPRKGVRGVKPNDILTDLVEIYRTRPPVSAPTTLREEGISIVKGDGSAPGPLQPATYRRRFSAPPKSRPREKRQRYSDRSRQDLSEKAPGERPNDP